MNAREEVKRIDQANDVVVAIEATLRNYPDSDWPYVVADQLYRLGYRKVES